MFERPRLAKEEEQRRKEGQGKQGMGSPVEIWKRSDQRRNRNQCGRADDAGGQVSRRIKDKERKDHGPTNRDIRDIEDNRPNETS